MMDGTTQGMAGSGRFPRKAYAFLFVHFLVLVLLFVGSVWLYVKTDAALQTLEEEQMSLHADHIASIVQRSVVSVVALGEDLEQLMLAEFNDSASLSDTSGIDARLARVEPAFKMVGTRSGEIAAVYTYLDPDLFGMHYLWYVRQDEEMAFHKDIFEGADGYLSKTSSEWGENESFVWYYAVLREQVPQWTDVYWDADVRTYYISYLRPLIVDGTFVGMVGVDVDMDGMRREVMSDGTVPGEVAILDEAGNFIYGSPSLFEDWNLTAALIEGDRGGFQLGNRDIGYRRLPNGVLVVVVVDEDESPLPMDLLQSYLQIAVIIATLLIVVGGGWAVTELLLRRYGASGGRTSDWSSRTSVIVLGAIAIIIVVGTVGLYHQADRILEEYEDERIAMTVTHAAGEVEEITTYVERTANDMGAVVASEFDPRNAQQYLDGIAPEIYRITAFSNDFTGSYVYLDADAFGVRYLWFNLEDGRFVRRYDEEANVPGYLSTSQGTWREDPDYVWYYGALLHGAPVWTAMYTDTDLGYDCISYAVPIYRERRIIGVAGIDVSLLELQDALSNMSMLRSRAVLLDKDGAFIVGSPDVVADWDALERSLGPASGDFHVGDKEVGYRRLSNGMTIVVVGDVDESREMIGNLRRVLFWIALVAVVLLVGAVALLQFRRAARGGWDAEEMPPARAGVRADLHRIYEAFRDFLRK